MKRFHVHVHVGDLERSVEFYSTLFGERPSLTRPGYAKWMLEDPRLNFAISTAQSQRGLSHLGIQVETATDLSEIAERGAQAQLATHAEREATCCYAVSNKNWFTDPQGIAWETFETLRQTEAAEQGMCSPSAPGRACCG